MADSATPNLPSRDFSLTARFYERLGFRVRHRDDGWMILERGALVLEFFVHAELDPLTSWFSCCLRVDDLDALYTAFRAAGIVEATTGQPRLHPPALMPFGLRMGALVDPDGTLLRLIENARPPA